MKSFIKNIDERNLNTIGKVCTIMYFLNIFILSAILLYRQFVLHQDVSKFTDFANLLVFNVVVVISAILYLGGITFPRIRLRILLLIYLAFVIVGSLFTLFKYNVLLDQPLSFYAALEKLGIVVVICGLFMLVYGLFAYLGYRKIEKNI